MDFKIELNEDFTKLYEPLISNKITVNWENKIYYNDYNSEIALILYKLIDSIKHEFNKNDIEDCENLLLGKYLTIDKKGTTIYGNFIKLVYYFYTNYDIVLRKYFLSLEDSFDISLNNFSKKTTLVYIILEVIAFISFLFFFIINMYFLIYSNKYIFQNILFMFIDFTQTQDYTFNNKYYNLLARKKVSNYILLLNEFTEKNLDLFKNDKEIDNFSLLANINLKSNLDVDLSGSFIANNNSNNNISMLKSNKIKKKIKSKKSKLYVKKTNTNELVNVSTSNMNSHNNLINNSNNNFTNNKSLKMLNEEIRTLNNKELNNILNYNSKMNSSKSNNSTRLILNSSFTNSNTLTNGLISNNSNLISSNKINKINERKSFEISTTLKHKIKNDNQKEYIIDEFVVNKNENNDIKITIEKIFFQTKVTTLSSVKYLIIIFIVFTLIFLVYYTYKIVISILFISDIRNTISDFKTLTSQYNHVIRYWNLIKTLFILPNTTLYDDLNKTEDFFSNINNNVNYVYNNRIKKYKTISNLYDYILDTTSEKNISSLDFCLEHKKCIDIKYSSIYLLSNGIESTVNIYAKEIFNYYKDYNRVKDTIKNKTDIIKNFMGERYNILGTNINHVFIYLEELFFSCFLTDEKDIINDFYSKIKILNIVEFCYCAILNLFSILFVYNYIARIINSVEEASMRINNSIRRMRNSRIEGVNY